MSGNMEQSEVQPQPQSAKMKHYYKNKENILNYYKSYYELNKAEILRKRREKYASQRPQRIRNEFLETIETSSEL
jgi:hypothetical protein